MKYKTTRRAIVNGSARLVSAGYCDLQFLLRNHNAVAYTCGVYGWNFDVYEVEGLTICTGYRNMPGRAHWYSNSPLYVETFRTLKDARETRALILDEHPAAYIEITDEAGKVIEC